MPPVFRIFALMCLAAITMNSFNGFVNNMYATRVAQPYQPNNFNLTVSQGKEEFVNYTAWAALFSTNRPKKETKNLTTVKLKNTSKKQGMTWTKVFSKNNTVYKGKAQVSSRNTIVSKAKVGSRNNNVSKVKDSSKNNTISDKKNINSSASVLHNATDDDINSIVDILYSDINKIDAIKTFRDVHKGGWYSPQHDSPQQSVAIIVPYRDRPKHLAIFLKYMHLFLMKQQIEYGIFVVEQEGIRPFNRGKLLNVGFVESQKMGNWKCFVFHDVDLLPLNHQIQYQCGPQPRHLSVAVDSLGFKLPHNFIFGGVTALTQEQFDKANGCSNRYWGWGGEDNDLFRRLWTVNYRITRYNISVARYSMLDHIPRPSPNLRRRELLINATKMFKKDGLSSLKYTVTTIVWHQLHTQIVVNIDESSDSEDFGDNMLGDKLRNATD